LQPVAHELHVLQVLQAEKQQRFRQHRRPACALSVENVSPTIASAAINNGFIMMQSLSISGVST
jgi:hypothetical protein